MEKKRALVANRSVVKDKYAICVVAAKKLNFAHNELLRAEEAKEIKNNAKNQTRYANAESAFKIAKKEYVSFVKIYDDLVMDIISAYSEIISEESPKSAKKLSAELSRFESKENSNKDALVEKIRGIDIKDAEAELKARPMESRPQPVRIQREAEGERYGTRPQPQYTAPQYNPPQYQSQPRYYQQSDSYRPYPQTPPQYQQPTIAPTSIDISGVVKDAVDAAMKKFVSAFERRIDEYTEALGAVELPAINVQAVNSGASVEVGSAVAAMAGEVLENERAIAEKLASLMDNIKELSDKLAELGASCMSLTKLQCDASEEARKANDMQRKLTRDIQGVIVNQKLIMQEAASLSGEQAALIEQQKANAENQKILDAASAEINEMQKSVLESENALAESVREVIATQKSIISSHQSVIGANMKNLELQRDLTEKQVEANTLQKSAISEHKQFLRELRRQRQQIAEKKKAIEKELSEEGAEGESTVISEEIEIEALAANEN